MVLIEDLERLKLQRSCKLYCEWTEITTRHNLIFDSLSLILVKASGANPMLLFLATVLGAHFTSMSPFSTGGSVFMGMNRDESIAKKLVTGQLVVCLVAIAISCMLATILALVM